MCNPLNSRPQSCISNPITEQFCAFTKNVSDFFNSLFNNVGPTDTHSLKNLENRNETFPIKAIMLYHEIKRKACNTHDISSACDLAKKISTLVGPIAPIVEEEPTSQMLSEDVIYASYQLASILKSTNPLQRTIWENLSPKVQKLFNILLPYLNVTTGQEQNTIEFGSVKVLPTEDFHLSFADKRLFRVKFIETRTGTTCFELPDTPDVVLTGIAKAPFMVRDMMSSYLEFMPSTINDVFDIKSLKEKLPNLESLPDIHKEIWSQINHQLFVLKTEYMKMLLESFGVPVDRALLLSTVGEWHINPKGQLKVLTSEKFDQYSAEKIDITARQIRTFFELERKFGIDLLGGDQDNINPKNLFTIRDESEVYQRPPLKILSFINGSIEERHSRIQDLLKDELPEGLLEKIFHTPFVEPIVNEKAAQLLGKIIDKGFLTKENILIQSEDVLEIFRSLRMNETLLQNQNVIPWNKLKSLDRLITYLHFCEKIDDPGHLEVSLDAISETVYELVSNIPSGLKPHESQSEFLEEIPAIIEKDFLLRKKATHSVFKYLLNSFLESPEIPIEACFQTLIQSVTSKINVWERNERLHIPVLKDQKIEKDGSINYIYEQESAALEPFVHGILWSPILEELNFHLFPEIKSPTIDESIALLRSVHFSSDNNSEMKNELTEKLFQVVHNHMLIQEHKRLMSQLRDRITTHI